MEIGDFTVQTNEQWKIVKCTFVYYLSTEVIKPLVLKAKESTFVVVLIYLLID